MTPERIAKLRKLVASATPGPWSRFSKRGTIAVDVGPRPHGKHPNIVDWPGFDGNEISVAQNHKNAGFIAKSISVIPECLDEIERLKAEIATLQIDAKRYKWLRERDLEKIKWGGTFVGQIPSNLVLSLEDCDAAIDEAMAREQEAKNATFIFGDKSWEQLFYSEVPAPHTPNPSPTA